MSDYKSYRPLAIYMLLVIVLILSLTGCVSGSEQFQQTLDRLEFKPGEKGCVSINGQMSLGGNPIFGSTANVNYKKTSGEGAPACG